jgi:hypothetical protein
MGMIGLVISFLRSGLDRASSHYAFGVDKSPAKRSCYDDDGPEGWVFRLPLWAIAPIFRRRALLIAENLCLRQQLLVPMPDRCNKRPSKMEGRQVRT